MITYKKPLKRSILTAILVFLVLLGIVLSVSQYLHYHKALYERYEYYIENVLRYTAAGIDTDDLAECIRTGVESDKYRELQKHLDNIRAGFDMHFLYVIIPLHDGPVDNIQNVIAAMREYAYENTADKPAHLNSLTGDSYSPSTARQYLNAYNSGSLSFFEEVSQWGDNYTGLLPLYDSAGNKIAALCMDIDIQNIHTALRQNTLGTIVIIALLGIVFALLFLSWSGRNITKPIEELEDSAVRFASTCLEQTDPEALKIKLPEIHTDNEVESLALAILKMSEAMRSYLRKFIYAENELARMTILANKDALTSVGNKNAYNSYILELEEKQKKESFPFVILMVDLNYLKRVNDTYGHEKGDLYLKRCCSILCKTFANSPVFRIGGDEFTVVLIGPDYENRTQLLRQARETFDGTLNDEGLAPWERVSVAIGMAEYRGESTDSMEDTLERADKNMYREKRRMKITR